MGGVLIVKAKELAGRVTSVSAMGFGVGFKPKQSERAILRELFIFLEDRRALHASAIVEQPDYVVKSVLKIREELTETLKKLDDKTPAALGCRAMRAACRDFLKAVPEDSVPQANARHLDGKWEYFLLELGSLRNAFGQRIAELGHLYKIDIEGELVLVLPPIIDDEPKLQKSGAPRRG